MSKQLKADLMILLVTIAWGASFYAIDVSLREIGPLTLNAYRFGVAFFIIFAFFPKKLIHVNKQTLKYSFLTGIALALAYIFATYGVLYTSLSNVAFLCAMSVIFTPILGFLFKHQSIHKKFILVLVICVTGMALLTLNEEFKLAFGDIICIGCSIAFAINLLIIETAVTKEEVNPFQLSVYVLAMVGIIMTVLSLLFETPTLPQTPAVWVSTLFLAIFCTGLAMVVQVMAQQHTTASHVGLIYTMEPVFAAIVAYIMIGEVLSPRGYLGASMMLLSIVIMEVDLTRVLSRGKRVPLEVFDEVKTGE